MRNRLSVRAHLPDGVTLPDLARFPGLATICRSTGRTAILAMAEWLQAMDE
ncbi:MAG: hypothetical protein R3F41_02780 [Gammaproteobacteria bacterium]|nr:hypothetical protein [Pseudomonadales bacterium]